MITLGEFWLIQRHSFCHSPYEGLNSVYVFNYIIQHMNACMHACIHYRSTCADSVLVRHVCHVELSRELAHVTDVDHTGGRRGGSSSPNTASNTTASTAIAQGLRILLVLLSQNVHPLPHLLGRGGGGGGGGKEGGEESHGVCLHIGMYIHR